MNISQILVLTILVGAILFFLQGIETRILRNDLNKVVRVLRATLEQLDRIHK